MKVEEALQLTRAAHPCADCGMQTTPCKIEYGVGEIGFVMHVTPGTFELYLVKDRIWKKAGMPKNGGGSLCVGCIEKRLGRRLVPQDFAFGHNGYNVPKLSTPRLRARLGLDPLANIDLEG